MTSQSNIQHVMYTDSPGCLTISTAAYLMSACIWLSSFVSSFHFIIALLHCFVRASTSVIL